MRILIADKEENKKLEKDLTNFYLFKDVDSLEFDYFTGFYKDFNCDAMAFPIGWQEDKELNRYHEIAKQLNIQILYHISLVDNKLVCGDFVIVKKDLHFMHRDYETSFAIKKASVGKLVAKVGNICTVEFSKNVILNVDENNLQKY